MERINAGLLIPGRGEPVRDAYGLSPREWRHLNTS